VEGAAKNKRWDDANFLLRGQGGKESDVEDFIKKWGGKGRAEAAKKNGNEEVAEPARKFNLSRENPGSDISCLHYGKKGKKAGMDLMDGESDRDAGRAEEIARR